MIDKKPTPGDLTHWVMEPYEADSGPVPTLHEQNPARVSSVLGPDGSPVTVAVPRRKLGFDLSRGNKESQRS